LYNSTTDPQRNARALELFYDTHEQWDPFVYTHPHLGRLWVRFAAPVNVPAAAPNSGGLIEAFEIELVDTGIAAPAPPPFYDSYPLALNFVGQDYRINGVDVLLPAVPSFSYARTGAMEVLDTNGVDAFAAATIPVNNKGYHAYDALDNKVTASQALDSLTKYNVTITSDDAAAPDGTVTADKLVPAGGTVFKGIGYNNTISSGKSSASIFVKKGAHRYWQMYTDAINDGWATFDVQTGAVVAGNGGAGYVVDNGDYVRLVLIMNRASGTSTNTYLGMVDTGSAGWNSSTASTTPTHLWQFQVITGEFQDGGPIILSPVGNFGTIGAADFHAAMNPITADEDFIWWGIANLPELKSGYANNIAGLGAGTHSIGRNGSGNLFVTMGSTQSSASTFLTAGRYVVMARRRSGKTTLAYKLPNGTVTVMTEGSTSAYGTPTSNMNIGRTNAGSDHVQGTVEGVYIARGPFTDVDMSTLLGAA
jgi:hypothetical protein